MSTPNADRLAGLSDAELIEEAALSAAEQAAALADMSSLAGLIMIREVFTRMDETCPCTVCAWLRQAKEKRADVT